MNNYRRILNCLRVAKTSLTSNQICYHVNCNPDVFYMEDNTVSASIAYLINKGFVKKDMVKHECPLCHYSSILYSITDDGLIYLSLKEVIYDGSNFEEDEKEVG